MFKFMRWWWERQDDVTQAMVLIIFPTIIIGIVIISTGPAGLFSLGAHSLLLLFAPVSLAGLYMCIRTLIDSTRSQYSIFREENPTEDERIILKLKGKL